MTDQQLRLGIVGAGFFGQVAHIANYARLPTCRLVALAEMRFDLREQVAAKFSIPATFATHHELLQHTDVQAVVVVTARPAMGPIVLDCLNAGKHVLSEKPLAGTAELADRLVAAAQRNGVQYVVGYMKRHDVGVQEAKRVLEQLRATGELGALTYARAHCFAGDAYCGERDYIASAEPRPTGLVEWPMAPDWLPREEHAGYERYLNTYCHNLNLLRYLLRGESRLRQARISGSIGLAEFEWSGIPVLLETGILEHAGWDEVTEIFFERGLLRIETPAPLSRNTPARAKLYRGGPNATWETLSVEPSWAFVRQAEAFVTDILEQRTPLACADDAAHDVRLIEEIWRLAHSK